MTKEELFAHILEMDSGCAANSTPENVLKVVSPGFWPQRNKYTQPEKLEETNGELK